MSHYVVVLIIWGFGFVNRLAKEGREQLQRSGWCEKLKESMRAAKKQKGIGEQMCSKEIDKAMIRYFFDHISWRLS